MESELALTGAALLALVFLSTIESAYESLSEVSLRVMASERGERGRARFFKELLDNRRRFELMLILGTQLSIAAIAIALFSILLATDVRAPMAAALLALFVVILIFRQFLPRLIAQNHPEEVFWAMLPIFRIFYLFLYPFIIPISAALDRMKTPEEEQAEVEEDEEETLHEITAFIDVGQEEGIIEESEGELIQSIIEFGDTEVGEIMRPRPQIVAIEANETIAAARELIITSKYSRIPVYRDQIDNIEGVVYVRDLLAYCVPGKMGLPVTECMRPAYFVPESKPIAELFEEMQKAKVQIAMVIDEYGGMAGLVTTEDIIEEILGEIEDEDRAADEHEIVRAEDGSYLVEGSAEIRKVELLYDKEVEADDFTTVAGLIIKEMGHVPAVGEKLEFKGLQFEVVDANSKRINRVRLRAIEDVESGKQQSG
ncbi:MAG TPA: hemolysin family protein [Blastocatellia bacterium]|nr:hemolysin family protein [Blastocatellia bacterium]